MAADKTVTCVDIDGEKHTVPVSQLHWRPSAYGIVMKDGQLLTAKQFGRYNLPGGGIEFGEMPEAAVIREIKEETGIIAARPKLISVASMLFKLPRPDRGREYFQTLLFYYVCDFSGGEFSTDGFDEYEKEYAEMPEWYLIANLDKLQVTGSHDWRPLVEALTK
jgi:8-oxo-dGTP diphosphatase